MFVENQLLLVFHSKKGDSNDELMVVVINLIEKKTNCSPEYGWPHYLRVAIFDHQ